jgi:hypothetical protein
MAEYRCHDREQYRARSQVAIDAPDDATVLLEAEQLLASSRFVAMEVWRESRLVGRVTVGTPAELAEGEGSQQSPRRKRS